jgi:hypothetical protein
MFIYEQGDFVVVDKQYINQLIEKHVNPILR